ncbi:AI-2E family transporter [Secundilactobacillus kimchicus]|uniref:Permease n=1 Tax=Secundilactobacillus kimchicus JCM 15530 TaxID=1302272 RepID=A0A0R1HRW6_9LACO|nr:AI-2E family transporter [Secundilactobacillus kimchicus]KRK49557.1 permease [Secundilactobacillus kimchicus JCM 15530]
MILKQPRPKIRTWFTSWFLDNKVVVSLLVLLLILLNVLILSKLPGLWAPIQSLFDILGVPVIIAGVGYYLINPLVDWLQHRFNISRLVTITVVFVVIFGLIAWGIFSVIPVVQEQLTGLINNWPTYWHHTEQFVLQSLSGSEFDAIRHQLTDINDQVNNFFKSGGSNFVQTSLNSIGHVVSHVSTIAIAVITAPFVLFYLLKDGHQLPEYMVQFIPVRKRVSFLRILTDMNRQVSNYVRGQLTVAFFVAVIFAIGYGLIGMKFALLLGIASGLLNLIPYLGSFLAMVPAIVIGAFVSPVMLLKVLIVFVIEQTLEGRIISPLVLGNTLKIHPVTIIFILLASGKLFGIVGVILGIPGYAVLKVIGTEIFHWYQSQSQFEAPADSTK